jgi:hypothetical protein
MTNSTKEEWSVSTPQGGSLSLNQYSWSITSFGVGRMLPTMRGDNIQVAYIPGQVWRKKFPDSRVITLTMWTAGIDPATDQPAYGPYQHLQMSDNLKTLQAVFYNVGGNQFELTRKWEYTLPVSTGIPTGVPTMVVATALAEVAGNMQVQTQGASSALATFSIDLLLADPYFYGPAVSFQIPYNAVTPALNTGDDVAAYYDNTVTFYGPLQFPRLTNTTTSPTTWVQLNTIIAAGDSITFDVANFTAYRQSDGANMSGSVTHSGTRRWMSYNPGVNQMLLSSGNSGDTGSCAVSFVPPYV